MSERNIKQLVLEQLRNTKIPKSDRKNISTSKDARGFALGTVLVRGIWVPRQSKNNAKYPKLYELLTELIALYKPNFKYSTIQVNYGFACKKHCDKNNVGPSYTISLGDFDGGELEVDDREYVTTYVSKNRFIKFNGNNEHWVLPFEGERYSIVYFTHTFNGRNKKIYM